MIILIFVRSNYNILAYYCSLRSIDERVINILKGFLHFINVYSNEIFIFSNKFSLLNIYVLNICAALYLYNVNSNDLLLRKINLFRFILTQDIHRGILLQDYYFQYDINLKSKIITSLLSKSLYRHCIVLFYFCYFRGKI